MTRSHDRCGDGDIPCGSCIEGTNCVDAGDGTTIDGCAVPPPPTFCRLFDRFFGRASAISIVTGSSSICSSDASQHRAAELESLNCTNAYPPSLRWSPSCFETPAMSPKRASDLRSWCTDSKPQRTYTREKGGKTTRSWGTVRGRFDMFPASSVCENNQDMPSCLQLPETGRRLTKGLEFYQVPIR